MCLDASLYEPLEQPDLGSIRFEVWAGHRQPEDVRAVLVLLLQPLPASHPKGPFQASLVGKAVAFRIDSRPSVRAGGLPMSHDVQLVFLSSAG